MPLLGDYFPSKISFIHLESRLKELKSPSFFSLKKKQQLVRLHSLLCQMIDEVETPCFLLPAVLECIAKIHELKLYSNYQFHDFEFWLNQESGLPVEKNLEIRGKIAGKWIRRSDYESLFPIGMGKVYEGSHFVTAHRSPDLDTTVASFWGWLDAFAARVSDGLHLWNVPGGPPSSQVEIQWLFEDIFGKALFSHLAKDHQTLSLTALDLVKKKELESVEEKSSMYEIDHHRMEKAVAVIDEKGDYRGDFREIDVEGISQLLILFASLIRWFEIGLYLEWNHLFSSSYLQLSDFQKKMKEFFAQKIKESEPFYQFSAKQKEKIDQFLVSILSLSQGSFATFEELFIALKKLSSLHLSSHFIVEKITPLFDSQGNLKENRTAIFECLKVLIQEFNKQTLLARTRLEKLDVVLKIKEKIFGHHATAVDLSADLAEIRSKIGSYLFLTALHPEENSLVGAISSLQLKKPFLATVSLRDFCNRDEMGIPDYFQVISVIDHHKSKLQTFSPPFAYIADVQSSNTLVALRAFEINDRYGLGGQSLQEIEKGLEDKNSSIALLERALKKKRAFFNKKDYFIDPTREVVEYLHFLYAIFDDTDLLSKVSQTDVECVVELVNRIGSLVEGKEKEILSLEDLPRDLHFTKKASARILQNQEVYSLYRKVYEFREEEVARNLEAASKKEPSHLFADTKEQNGCCRVGQSKMFAQNVALFEKLKAAIMTTWQQDAELLYQKKKEVDLHLHMMSTIVSAEEVYLGKKRDYLHKDELWIWIPNEEIALVHLRRFLLSFKESPGLVFDSLELECRGPLAKLFSKAFKDCFLEIPTIEKQEGPSVAILRYAPGSLNSRKAMISPFLPTL